jgi:hypothetical protein
MKDPILLLINVLLLMVRLQAPFRVSSALGCRGKGYRIAKGRFLLMTMKFPFPRVALFPKGRKKSD